MVQADPRRANCCDVFFFAVRFPLSPFSFRRRIDRLHLTANLRREAVHSLENVSVHPVYGNPRTGLLRTLWEFQDRVLGNLLRGLCVQGADHFFQISGRNFLPELRGEVHSETAPLRALCCAPCSTEQSTFRGEENGGKGPRNGEEEGSPTKAQKGKIGNENSAQSFSDRSFWKSLWVGAFGSWMSAPKCLFFFQDLTALTEVLGRDIRANDPRTSAGCPSQKLPLWADFSILKKRTREDRSA